jgi:hypothetical protein
MGPEHDRPGHRLVWLAEAWRRLRGRNRGSGTRPGRPAGAPRDRAAGRRSRRLGLGARVLLRWPRRCARTLFRCLRLCASTLIRRLRRHLPGCCCLAVRRLGGRSAGFDHPIGIGPRIRGCWRRKARWRAAAWLPVSRLRTRVARNPPRQRGGLWQIVRCWSRGAGRGLRRSESRLRLAARLRPRERQNSASLAHAHPPGQARGMPAPDVSGSQAGLSYSENTGLLPNRARLNKDALCMLNHGVSLALHACARSTYLPMVTPGGGRAHTGRWPRSHRAVAALTPRGGRAHTGRWPASAAMRA